MTGEEGIPRNDRGRYEIHSSVLMALARNMERQCEAVHDAYYQCKANDANPESCLQAGASVSKCAAEVVLDAEKKCSKELHSFAKCFKDTNNFGTCRQEQSSFLQCFPPLSE